MHRCVGGAVVWDLRGSDIQGTRLMQHELRAKKNRQMCLSRLVETPVHSKCYEGGAHTETETYRRRLTELGGPLSPLSSVLDV